MNSSLAHGLIEKVQRLALDADSFAFLLIDDQGVLRDKGGELTSLDLPDWRIGENILDKALFLHGYLPLSTAHERIVSYQLGDSCVIDIHLLDDQDGVLILLIDRSADTEEEARVRQRQNEARLRQRYSKPRDGHD